MAFNILSYPRILYVFLFFFFYEMQTLIGNSMSDRCRLLTPVIVQSKKRKEKAKPQRRMREKEGYKRDGFNQ